ncbi:MIR motif-containing protein [Cladochytrium replicatum]|nr:MIR motif-containing protein [Cladochytrium replicatum]
MVKVLAIACWMGMLGVGVAGTGTDDFVIEEEFSHVTCGSAIKLANVESSYRLHSHSVSYGSGSGQQSVTGFAKGDDPNSYFMVYGTTTSPCIRGEAIECNRKIRLQHVNTKKYLHSHSGHASPLSNNQEVSAYEGNDSGDGECFFEFSPASVSNPLNFSEWKVVCTNSAHKYWAREENVKFVHGDTGRHLSASTRFQYRNPIPGQLEVSGVTASGPSEQWVAVEGIYFSDRKYD